eukprot:349632-Chlamydomonas_euryale.AAC.14
MVYARWWLLPPFRRTAAAAAACTTKVCGHTFQSLIRANWDRHFVPLDLTSRAAPRHHARSDNACPPVSAAALGIV